MSNGTFHLTPVLKRSDLMWFHQRMRGGQQIFELAGIDRKPEVRGYEIAIWERGSSERGFLAMKYHRRTQPEAYIHYYRRRPDGDFQWIRAEEYAEDFDGQDFFQLMGELNDEQFLKGWQNT